MRIKEQQGITTTLNLEKNELQENYNKKVEQLDLKLFL